MKQKMFCFGDDFVIKDESGRDVYFVDGRAFSIGDKLSFQDMQRNELAFIRQKLLSWGPTYEIYRQDELVAVVSTRSKLVKHDEITVKELCYVPLVLRERGSGTLDVLETSLLSHNVRLSDMNVLMYLGSTESIKLFLENTDCMGIVSVRSIDRELVAGQFKVIEIKDLDMEREFSFVRLQGEESGLSQVFMQFAEHYNKNL